MLRAQSIGGAASTAGTAITADRADLCVQTLPTKVPDRSVSSIIPAITIELTLAIRRYWRPLCRLEAAARPDRAPRSG